MSDNSLRDAASRSERRIVVFAGASILPSTVEALEHLVQAVPHVRLLVIEAGNPPRTRMRWLRSKLRRLRGEPVSYPLELLGQLGAVLAPREGEAASDVVRFPQVDELPNVWKVSLERLHGDLSLEAVRRFEPWLGVSIGAPILRRKLFEIPERGTINVHKSHLPEYRGMPSGFWELHDGAAESGVSIHWVDDAIDTGEIILQRKLKIPAYATPVGLLAQLDDLATQLLTEAVQELDGENTTRTPQLVPRTPTRSRPPYLLRKRVEKRCRIKRDKAGAKRPMLRDFAKRQLRRVFVHAWSPVRNSIRRARGENRTTILLYHRVSDHFSDKVTTGVERFTRHLEVLKRNYDVLDMEQWLAERGKPRRRPAVLITFDDGYVDNHLAARLCRRAGVPCTFFVCTGIVGTDSPFLHDLQRLGVRLPALSWDHLREMQSWGFDIASHGVFHTDCGSAELGDALEEISTARRHLQTQLGERARDRWFAFPFGRRENITNEVLDQIERVGVEVVFSAWGGLNRRDFDLHNVQRIPVADCDGLELRALVEGWRLQLGPKT